MSVVVRHVEHAGTSADPEPRIWTQPTWIEGVRMTHVHRLPAVSVDNVYDLIRMLATLASDKTRYRDYWDEPPELVKASEIPQED